MNTLQIIYYFPLLSLYYPDELAQLLPYFSTAKMQIPIDAVKDFQSNIQSEFEIKEKLGMPVPNESYEDLEYESTGFLSSGNGILTMCIQSFISCCIIFGIRGFLFTLKGGPDAFEKEMNDKIKELEARENGSEINEDKKDENEKLSKAQKWLRKKIHDLSKEYKYNFFLRVGLQVYLELVFLSLLNIRYHPYSQTPNSYQILSLTLSFIFLFSALLFLCWSFYFGCSKYPTFKRKARVDIEEYESMYSQYKTNTLPSMLFNSYFMIRRILYAMIIVFLKDFPTMQVFSFVMICIPIFSLHVVIMPYHNRIENVLMIINELSLLAVGNIFYVFTDPKNDQDLMKQFGGIVIIILLFVISLNILVLMILKLKILLKELWEAYDANCRKSKKKPELDKPKEDNISANRINQDSRFRPSYIPKTNHS